MTNGRFYEVVGVLGPLTHIAIWLSGLVGGVVCLVWTGATYGLLAFLLGVVFFPATVALVPWIAVIHYGNWWPMIFVYIIPVALGIFGLALAAAAAMEQSR